MSTYAWFDISTNNNIGILDARTNDVLVRCLEPAQRFLFGATNAPASMIVNTNGVVQMTSNLTVPVITTSCINSDNSLSNVKIVDVDVRGNVVLSKQLETSNIFCSNITLSREGFVDAGVYVKASDYLEAPFAYADFVRPFTEGSNTIEIEANLNVHDSITVSNVYCSNVAVTNHVSANSISCTTQLQSPVLITNALCNNSGLDKIDVLGVSVRGSNISGDATSFHAATFQTASISNVTANVITNTTNLYTPNIQPISPATSVQIMGTVVEGGHIRCSNISLSNQLDVTGITTLRNKLNVLSNVDVSCNLVVLGTTTLHSNVTVSSSAILTCETRLVSPDIKANTINSYDGNGNLTLADGGVTITSKSNLITSNAFFANTSTSNLASCNVNAVSLETQSAHVNTLLNVSGSVTSPTLYTTQISPQQNVDATSIHDVVFLRSNVSSSGFARMSNVIVKESVVFENNCSYIAKCPVSFCNQVMVERDIVCGQTVFVPSLNVMSITSPTDILHVEGLTITGKSNLSVYNVDATVLNVQTNANIAQAKITTNLDVDMDLNCKGNVFVDNVKGYRTPGKINIEGVQITDDSTITLNTLYTSNVVLKNGSLVMGANTSIVKDDGNVILDVNGRLSGSNLLIPGSVDNASLQNYAITSEKIDTNVIQSRHLSSGLTFKGTCTFDNIALTGAFTISETEFSICGVAFSNGNVGIGGLKKPEYPLHVKGQTYIADGNVSMQFGTSNNIGVMNIHTTQYQTPVGIVMSQSNACSTQFMMATYPSCFGITSIQAGDIVIENKPSPDTYGKVFINDFFVSSTSNVGIWKQSPLAPLHTTVFAADKIAIGGKIRPQETIDMFGNVRITRDSNQSTVFMRLHDVDNRGVNVQLQPFDTTKKMFVYNEIGDVSVNARDQDPSTCDHVRIKSVSGFVGLCTSDPICPLHINNVVRPGASTPPQTVLLTAAEPSILFSNNSTSLNMKLGVSGRLSLTHNVQLPYVRFINTNRTYNLNDNVVATTDTFLEIGPHTQVTMFTDIGQKGNYEIIRNTAAQSITVPLSGPTRSYIWTNALRSIAISSMNAITLSTTSDTYYIDPTNNGGKSNVMTINNSLKLLGVGTSTPLGGVDICSSFGSNVMCVNGTPIIDTSLNFINMNSVSMRGPLLINGRRIFDETNNIVGVSNVLGITNVTMDGTLTKNGKLILDNGFNLSNIESFTMQGPFIYRNSAFLDVNYNMSNVRSVSVKGPIVVDNSVFLDNTMTLRSSNAYVANLVTCSNIQSSTMFSSNAFVLGSSGRIIQSNVDDMALLPKGNFYIANSNTNVKHFDVNVTTGDIKLPSIAKLSHDNKIILTSSRALSNITGMSLEGPIGIGSTTFLSSSCDVTASNATLNGNMTLSGNIVHDGKTVLDVSRSLSNISSISMNGNIVSNGKLFLDPSMNVKNVNTIDVEQLNIQNTTISCSNENELFVTCRGFKIDIDSKPVFNCTPTGFITCDSTLSVNCLKTSRIDATDIDDDFRLDVHQNRSVKTNTAFNSPKYTCGSYSFVDNMRATLHLMGPNPSNPQGENIQLCDISSVSTHFKKKVLINNPTEEGYDLAVGGTIYADQDIFMFSDVRRKREIRVIRGAMGRVRKLRGVTFKRSDCTNNDRDFTGLIAQEVQRVLPQAVATDSKSGLMSVAYGNIVGLLVEALKEIDRKIMTRSRIGSRPFKKSKLLKGNLGL